MQATLHYNENLGVRRDNSSSSARNLRKGSGTPRNVDLGKNVESQHQKTSSKFQVNSARKASAALEADEDENQMGQNGYKEMIMNILERKNRTDEEAWTLYEYIKDFKFFNQVLSGHSDPEDIIKVVKSLRYRKVKAGKPVFIEGEPSNGNMYVVFSGELLVMVKKLDVIALTNLTAGKKAVETKATFVDLPSPTLVSQEENHTLKAIHTENSADEDDVKPSTTQIASEAMISDKKKKSRFRNSSKTKIVDQKTLEKVKKLVLKEEEQQPQSKDLGSSLMTPTKMDGLMSADDFGSSSHHEAQDANPFGYVKDKIKRGGYFGERALESNACRSATILASTDCELLVLTTQTYNSLKNEFNRKIKQMMDFIINSLPGLKDINAKAIIKNYIYLFEERSYVYGNHIVNEGEKGEYFYFVYEGSCEVYRTIRIEEDEELPAMYSKIRSSFFSQSFAVKEKIPLTLLKEGGLIGEELLFSEEPIYNYSVQVNSNTLKVICVNKDVFQFRFPKEVTQKIKQVYEEKRNYKNNLFYQALEKRDIAALKGSIDTPFLAVKRKSAQDCSKKIAKINKAPSQFVSYKIMMQDSSPAENPKSSISSPVSLPKLGKSRSTVTLDPSEMQLKQKILSYSRANLMPGAKENVRSSQDFGSAVEEYEQLSSKYQRNHEVDHIRKSYKGSPYCDIKDVYENISTRLKLEKGSKTTKASINDASSMKLDFGKAYEFEEKWLAMAKKKITGKSKLPDNLTKITPSSTKSANLSPIRQHGNGAYADSPVSINKLHSVLKGFDLDKFLANKGSGRNYGEEKSPTDRIEAGFENIHRKKKSANTIVLKSPKADRANKKSHTFKVENQQSPKFLIQGPESDEIYSINQTPILLLDDEIKTNRFQKAI